MIRHISYPIENQLLNQGLLASHISKFWDDVFSPIILKNADKHLMVLVKVSINQPMIDHVFRTLGYLRRVNHNEKELFTEYLSERLAYLDDSYISNSVNKINFSYIEKDGLASDDDRRLLQDVSESKASFHRFNNLILPISMNPEDYGTILATTQFDTFTRYIVNNGKRNYKIDISPDKLVNKVTILGPVNLSWIDTQLTMDGVFKREIGKSTKYFLDGVNVLNKQQLPAKPFRNFKVDPQIKNSFITLDIETIKREGKLIPYLICGYNGNDYLTSFANTNSIETEKAQKDLFSNFKN